MSARTLIDLPQRVRNGQAFEIRVAIGHPMETGYRRGADGTHLPRDILSEFRCDFEGEPVLIARLFPAISAHPFLAFSMVAERSGELRFSWRGDQGFDHTERVALFVE
jgi:sulfur-oxidizing protein SoxZ